MIKDFLCKSVAYSGNWKTWRNVDVTLQGIAAHVLRNRLIMLHHFSELFCPCIPMFDLEQNLAGVGAGSVIQSDLLRALLVSSAKVTHRRVHPTVNTIQ